MDQDHISHDIAEEPLADSEIDGTPPAEDELDTHFEPEPEPDLEPETVVRDPLVSVLLTVALSLVVVVLGTVLVAFLYFTNLNRTPRTVAERDVTTWETAVRERPGDVNAWASLAYAYAQAKRYDDALSTLERAKRVNKEPAFVIVEADIYRLAGKHRDAISAYADAEKAVNKLREDAIKERKKVGVTYEPEDDSLMRVYYGRALSLAAVGDDEQAVEYMKKALKEKPEAASISIELGDLYMKLGDKPKAAKAYQAALTYIPDSAEAQQGLARAKGESR